MKFFLFLLFLLLLFDSLQGSTLPHKRCTRGLNTTLQTNFNGIYQRRNPCTNAEIETSSYVASHEFRHHTKENKWTDYSHKCSSIISGFLQAIGNLVRFNNKQNGTFNFHINTSISQKQDRCDSMPTIIIEATDCEISPRSSYKSSSDKTKSKGKVDSFSETLTNERKPNQVTSTKKAADQNQKYEKLITGQPEEIVYLDDYPTTAIPLQETTAQYQVQEREEKWQHDKNSWNETQTQTPETEYSPAVFTDILQKTTDEQTEVFQTSTPNESDVELTTPYVSTEDDSLTSNTSGSGNISPNTTPNPFIYYSTTGTDFEGKSRQEQTKQQFNDNWGGKVPNNQRTDFVSSSEQTLTTKVPSNSDGTQLQRPFTHLMEEYQPAEFEATPKTPLGFSYRPEVSTSFSSTTVESEYDELSDQNSGTKPPQGGDFYTDDGKPFEGQTQYSTGYATPTTQTPPFEMTTNYPDRFSTYSAVDQTKKQSAVENLSPVTAPNPNVKSMMPYNTQTFQHTSTSKIQSPQSLIKSDVPEFPKYQPPQPFTNERIPEYSSRYANIGENQMTDRTSVKPQNTFIQHQRLIDEALSRQFPETLTSEHPTEHLKVSPPRPTGTQTFEERITTTDYQTTAELGRQPLRDFNEQYAESDRETGPDYLRQQTPTFLQPESQIRGNAIAPGFRPTFSPKGPRENVEILQPRSPSDDDGVIPMRFSTTPTPEYSDLFRESKKSEPAFKDPQNVTPLKEFQSQMTGNTPPGELPQPPSSEQQGNFEVPQSRYTTTEIYEDEFQTATKPTYRPSLQFGNNGNIAQASEELETSNQSEPQFITEIPEKSNENSEYRFISTETTPSQFQTTPIPEYTDDGQTFDVTTISPGTLNNFDQSESQLGGNAPLRQFAPTYTPEIEGIKIPQSQSTEIKTSTENEFQTLTKHSMQSLNNNNNNNNNQYENKRRMEIPNSAFLNPETSNTFNRPELQPPLDAPFHQFPPTSISERPTEYFETPQTDRTTSEISEEETVTTDFQTTKKPEYLLPLQYIRQREDGKTTVPDPSLSGFDEPKPPMAPDYGNSRQFSPNFAQNPRNNFDMPPLEKQREEPNPDDGQYRQQPNAFIQFRLPTAPSGQQPMDDFKRTNTQTFEEETVTTDDQTTAEPEHQTTRESTLNDWETRNESNSGDRLQQIPNTFGQPESQFRGNAPFPPHVYRPDNISPFTGRTSSLSTPDVSNVNIGNLNANSHEDRPTENRNDFQKTEMNFDDYRQDDYTTPTPFYGSKPTPNENIPPQEVEHSVVTAEERPSTAFKEESFADSAQTSEDSENGLSETLPSPAFVPRYSGQVVNENATTPIPNAPALYSEQTTPKISSLRWQSPAENHTYGSPADYDYRDPTFSGPPGMPVRPFDISRMPYFPNGRPQFHGMYPGRNNAPVLPMRPNLPYYPKYHGNPGAPEYYRLPSRNPDIRQPMDGSDFRNVRPNYNDRFPIPPGRYSDRPDYPGRYLNDFSSENQMRQEDNHGERPLMNPEIGPPHSSFHNKQFEQGYEQIQSERFSDNRPEPHFPPNFHSNERFSNDERNFRKPEQFRHDTMIEQPPLSNEFQSNGELGQIRRFPARPEPADFRQGGYNRQPTQEAQYYPVPRGNEPENRLLPRRENFPEQQNQQGNPVAPLQRHSVNNQEDSQSFSTITTFSPVDLSNSKEVAQDSFPPRDQYPTEVPPPQSISEPPVSYSQIRTHSELESQSLVSTPDHDQSTSNEFRATYNSDSQTESALQNSNNRPVVPEQRESDVAASNGDLIINGFTQPENLGNQPSPNQQELITPLPSEPNNNFNHFSTKFPKFTTEIYDETITTTESPVTPSKSSAQAPTNDYNRNLVENRQVLSTEEYDGHAVTQETSLPLNLDETPVSFTEATMVPMQSNFRFQQAQDNTPMNPPSNAVRPQPQPSLDYTTNISGYEATENTQTFDNSSPHKLEPGLSSPPYSRNTFTREFQEDEAYGNRGTIFPSRNLQQGSDQQFSLQTPPTVAMTLYDPLRKPQPIPETTERIENTSPQTQSTTVVKYDKETQTTDLSSPAPRLQPQMALKYSEDNSANISSDRQEFVTALPLDFTSTLPIKYEKISDRNTLLSSAENSEKNGQSLTQYSNPTTHTTQTIEYFSEDITDDSPTATTPPPTFPSQKQGLLLLNVPRESQAVATDETFQREPVYSAAAPQPPNYPNPEAQELIYDRQMTDTQSMNREGRPLVSYDDRQTQRDTDLERDFSERSALTSQKQPQRYTGYMTTPSAMQVNKFTSTNSETNGKVLASTPSTSTQNFTPLVTAIPFASEEHPSSSTIKVVEEILTTDFPVTDSPVDSQLAYATKLLDATSGSKELEILQEDKATPKTEKSSVESLTYSDQLSNVNERRRLEEPQFFDRKSPSQFFERNNRQQIETPMRGNPVYVPEQRNPMFDHNRNVSPQSEDMLKRYDEFTPDFHGRNPMDRQLFDGRKPNQPEADFPRDAGYQNSQQATPHHPMMFNLDNEPPKYPPPVNDEPHSNPLLHTLQSHMTFPLHDHPSQATAYSEAESEDQQNRFAPNPSRQEFERNFAPSRGAIGPPQPDSLVSDLNTPSNMPDLPATGRFGYMSRPLMNPWGRSNGRGVSTPERF